MKKAYLVLADGSIFEGSSFGIEGESSGEVVFNTSITGYQEIITDPSYFGQIVVMTYPHIGNYGVNDEDNESGGPKIAGLIVRSYSENYSNWRAKCSLGEYFKKHKIVAGTGFDTRSIVKHVRDNGAQPALLAVADKFPDGAVERARALPSMNGQDLVSEVTCKEVVSRWSLVVSEDVTNGQRPTTNDALDLRHIILYDFGVKLNIIRMLLLRGCDVTVVPASTSAEDVIGMKPNGIVLSNGPGDPSAVTYAVENIKKLLGKVPIFGICLGHQLLALALGGKTYKLKFGHRGGNQPVKNLKTGKVEITSQNHGFAVDDKSLKQEAGSTKHDIEITHINLNDNTVEGIAVPKLKAFSVQYHPEASPGPHDSSYLFKEFVNCIKCK